MKLIKPIIDQSILSIELTPEANKENITRRFKHGSLTLSSPSVAPGIVSTRKERLYPSSLVSFFSLKMLPPVNARFLGSWIRFWWWCRSVHWSHYKTVVPKRKKRSSWINIVLGVSASPWLASREDLKAYWLEWAVAFSTADPSSQTPSCMYSIDYLFKSIF